MIACDAVGVLIRRFQFVFFLLLVSFSTTWTWIRQIFRKLLDVQPIECQRLVCTCWVSASLSPNLDLIHFHNGNGFISRSSNMKPVVKRTKILCQARWNIKPVPTAWKFSAKHGKTWSPCQARGSGTKNLGQNFVCCLMCICYWQKMEYPCSCGLVFKLTPAGLTKCLERTR